MYQASRLKFMDYFFYAIVEAENVAADDMVGCMNLCGGDNNSSPQWSNKCCAEIKSSNGYSYSNDND